LHGGGITHYDSNQLEQAVSDHPSNSTFLLFPGDFTINAPLEIGDNVCFKGIAPTLWLQDRYAVIKTSGGFDAFKVVKASGQATSITFENLVIRGTKSGWGINVGDAESNPGGANITVKSCNINNFTRGISLVRGWNSRIIDSNMQSFTQYGISIEEAANNVSIVRCRFAHAPVGIVFHDGYSSARVNITNCEFGVYKDERGIFINNHKLRAGLIENNYFEYYDAEESSNPFIQLYDVTWEARVVIENNYFFGNNRISVGILSTFSDLLRIARNSFYNITTAIDINNSNCHNTVLDQNQFVSCTTNVSYADAVNTIKPDYIAY